MKIIKLPVVVLDRAKKSYGDSESYPGEGTYFFMECLPEGLVAEEGTQPEASLWCGIAVVKGGLVDYSLLCSGLGEAFEEIKKLIEEEGEEQDRAEERNPERIVVPRNERGEACSRSFNDVLRALAAAAGTLPEEVK